jgi:spermidine synthase
MKTHWTKSYRLEVIVFLCGAIGMTIELVGSRVVSPYFGNSLIVWTSLIGVILGSLSAGYYFGGKMADKSQSFEVLGVFLLLASLLTAVTGFVKEPLMSLMTLLFGQELRSASFASILILFGPVSFILGLVSPYAVKLKNFSSENSGRTVGNLYALSTLGSITGTFLTGFFLIPTFGNTDILYALAIILILVSAFSIDKIKRVHLTIAFLIFVLFYLNQGLGIFKLWLVADADSLYSRILVRITKDNSGKRVVTMSTDNAGIQSALDIDHPDELYFEYAEAYALSRLINPNLSTALMIGGGGYTFPRYFLGQNPKATMDVVEIDKKMTELARKYFFLTDDNRMSIFHQDARSFIRSTKNTYDVVFLDAFSSMTPPYHLTTREFMSDLKAHLREKGFLMINIVAAPTGDKSLFLKAELSTVKSVFPEVKIYSLENREPRALQNLMMVAYKENSAKDALLGKLVEISPSEIHPLLTDEWAPVEFLTRSYYTN